MGLRTFLGLKKKRARAEAMPFPTIEGFSQLHQDSWIVSETNGKRDGFFVEIGAFDGTSLSNTLLLERDYGWSGILVEPNPAFTIPILSTRKAKLCTQPVDSQSGNSVTMLFVTEKPEISAINRVAYNDMNSEQRKKDHVQIEMQTISLLDLLIKFNAPEVIDYISIDTEGNEFDILENFDFQRFDIRFFSLEHNFTEAEAKLDNLMRKNGYERVFKDITKFDAWYRKIS
ncbi:FkbM family methyltransferase [Neorhizobium sp. CSC1952]|uniref:FkbM family methyltransferase n=1 Tax=Neorhizobium sp. CSC1952 TaxID=2978974 RepID=UPI0025A57EBF|nr:FkbM family methyltransferase [Rhizobium sp. CSC1952]WJR66044.1 FkbM family methyltransferase [Rhizobium sp. CSC1952]